MPGHHFVLARIHSLRKKEVFKGFGALAPTIMAAHRRVLTPEATTLSASCSVWRKLHEINLAFVTAAEGPAHLGANSPSFPPRLCGTVSPYVLATGLSPDQEDSARQGHHLWRTGPRPAPSRRRPRRWLCHGCVPQRPRHPVAPRGRRWRTLAHPGAVWLPSAPPPRIRRSQTRRRPHQHVALLMVPFPPQARVTKRYAVQARTWPASG